MKKLFNQWRKMPQSAKSSIVFIIASFFTKGVSFVVTPIFTRILSTDQYGLVAIFNSWYLIIEVFALLGLNSAGVFNVGLNDYRDMRDRYISSVLVLCNFVTVIVFAGMFGAWKFFGWALPLPINLMVLMFLKLLFSPAREFWNTRLRYEYKYKATFFVTIVSSILSQVIAVACIKHFATDNGGEVRLWSDNMAQLLFGVPIFLLLLVRGKSFVDLKMWKKILVFALPLIPHYLAQHVMSSSDRIMISHFHSNSEAGIYSVVQNISTIASIIWASVNASLVPYTFENLNKKEYKGVNNISCILLIGYAVACFGVALVAPEVMRILAPEEYYSGIYAVPPICGISFMTALYNIYANIEFYYKKSSAIATATIVSTIANVVLNVIFIPLFGFIAAAWTTLSSYVLLVIVHYIGYKRCGQHIYDDKKVFAVSAACLIMCMMCIPLYSSDILRYIVVAAILITAIIKRKFILNMLKLIKQR